MTLKRTRHLDIYITIKELIEEHPDYPVNRLCKLGHITRASYYKWKTRVDNENDILNKQIAEKMDQIHGEHPDMGYRRIRDTLEHDYNIKVNDKRAFKLPKLSSSSKSAQVIAKDFIQNIVDSWGINYHQALFKKHLAYNIDNKEIFINKCKENNHNNKLEFYCKNHNQLCCAACITKIKANGFGQHIDCNICILQDIKEEKKNKLKDNIKYLEDLSNNLDNSIKELKILFNKINENKEELKLRIQKIFTKIRNCLNEREDELLSEVDNKYKKIFCNEDIIKESEKLPNKIKLSLEKGKLINNEWSDNNKLSSTINDCLNIEDNIKNINLINNNITKCKLNKDINIQFYIENENFDNYIKTTKSFGKIIDSIIIESLILKNKDDKNKFYNLLSSQIKINNMHLLYRASRDGLKLNDLKSKINNKSDLIFLFLTGNTRIFGIFFKIKIEVKHDIYQKDENAFVFSLNNNKIYKILIPQYAIKFYHDYPILIGNNSNCNGFYFNSGSIYDKKLLNSPKIYDFQKNSELTEGSDKFTELEIFEINLY